MIRVVIDTNVLVSALISRHGPNARVLDLVLADKIRPCVSEAVLNEYRGVLGRPKFRGLSSSYIDALIGLLEKVSLKVTPVATLQVSSDEPDNRVYECADAAQAHYIVTGNRKHFATPHRSLKIVNAREFLEILAETNEPG
jgi:putative PIN family toxin of toxin-antitoxin system